MGWLSFVWARPLILIHHILVPFIVVPLVLMQGEKRGDYLIAAFCLMEASTPFVSARRILEILGNLILCLRFYYGRGGIVGWMASATPKFDNLCAIKCHVVAI